MTKTAAVDQVKPAPVKLMDEAYFRIEKMIVTGELAPGQWVSETELMKLSGLSRAPIRSAIQRLADQQLVEIFARKGAQVCPIDYTQQFRALELRRVVERLIASSAAERASDRQRSEFAELSKALRAVVETLDPAAMIDLDARAFALALMAADNPFAAKSMTSVKGLARRFWVLHQAEFGDVPRMATCHADITAAIASGDQDASADAVDRLIDYLEDFTLKVIGFNRNRSAVTGKRP